MASRTVVTFVDDLDGSDADETVQFALDGVTYEIDLGRAHASSLRAGLAPWVDAARRSGRPATVITARRSSAPTRVDPAQTAKVREWAAKSGHPVSARGRIPQKVMDAFQEAHAR